VHTISSFGFGRMGRLTGLSLVLALLLTAGAQAQTGPEAGSASGGRILLVLPFDNRTGQPSLEWIREASAEILSRRLASAGFSSMSRADRIYALDHLGLPQGFHPSRATALKLAETLDADSIIVGSYVTDGSGLLAEARLVDVPHLRMSQPVTARGEMRELVAIFDSLAWELTRQMDPGFKVSQESFLAAGSGLRLDAFEQYIRGITEPDQQERLRHLNQSVLLSPKFSPAWMALGREEYAGQRYEQAAEAFTKVEGNGANADDALEAGFYRGLSLLFSGDYARAEEAFARVARELPLAEVLNNQGVALARQGKNGIPLFRQAVAADPNGADYHFSLAVSLKRHGEDAEAATELAQCLRLRPNDSEAQSVQKAWTNPEKSGAAAAGAAKPAVGSDEAEEEAEAKADPLERIQRSFDEVAFRQAALMLDRISSARLSTLPQPKRAQELCSQAHEYLDHGLLLESERLYQAAVTADPKLAAAYAGLAEVRERTGDAKAARKEAVTSLELMPSVDAYLVLVRLDLAANHLEEAKQNAEAALQIDPQSKPALELRRQIAVKGGLKR
jgi:tetratricopeptide (TPR) repeat protein